MLIFQGETRLQLPLDFEKFVQHYRECDPDSSTLPYLLLRPDGERLEIVTHEGRILLIHAFGNDYVTASYESGYVDERVQFAGITEPRVAATLNFVDRIAALKVVALFFQNRPTHELADLVEFRSENLDSTIIDLPLPIRARFDQMKRKFVPREIPRKSRVERITNELYRDLSEFYDQLVRASGRSEVQVHWASLRGGQVNRGDDDLYFTHHAANGEVWEFELDLTSLEGVINRAVSEVKVEVVD